MLIRKNLATNIIWFLFVILTFCMLLVTSSGIAARMGHEGDILFIGISYFIVFLGALAIFGISFLVKKITFNTSISNVKETSGFLEFLYVLFVAILLVMIRFIYLVNAGDNSLNDMNYYKMALSGNFTAASDISPLAYTYVRFLSYIFTSYGTNKSLGFYSQIIFHLIIFLCIYFTLKYLIDRVAAVFGSASFVFLSYNIEEVGELNPGAFLNAVFSISFLLLIYACYLSYRNRLNRIKLFVYFIISGIFAGFFAYLDFAGIAYTIVGIIYIIFLRASNRNRKIYSPKLQIPLFIFGSLIGFIACYLIRGIIDNTSFVELILKDYNFSLYNFALNFYIDSPAYGTYFSAFILGLSILWIFRIFSIERDYGSPVILFAFIVALLSLFSLSRDGYVPLMTLIYIHLAVYGFKSLGNNTITDIDIALIESETISIDERIKEENKDTVKDQDKIKLKERKKELQEIKKKEKESKMQKNVTSGINTTLTLSDKEFEDSELDFVKRMNEKIDKDSLSKKESPAISVSPVVPVNPVTPEPVPAVNLQVTENHVLQDKPAESAVTQTNYNPVLGKPVFNSNTVNSNQTNSIQDNNTNNTTNSPIVVNNTVAEPVIKNDIVNNVDDNTENRKIVSVLSNDAKKFGKRMDYRTAIVKSSNSVTVSNAINETKPDSAPNDVAVKTNNETVNNQTVVKQQKVEFIKNPLPVPPKRIPREMDFDIIPAESDMHFDIVDLKNKDFFDIN